MTNICSSHELLGKEMETSDLCRALGTLGSPLQHVHIVSQRESLLTNAYQQPGPGRTGLLIAIQDVYLPYHVNLCRAWQLVLA